MPFRTKIDFSDNRQAKQRIETIQNLSGATHFGVDFSQLPTGPDLTTSAVTFTNNSVISTFSGNSGTTVFSFTGANMNIATSYLSAITPSNSATTQSTGNVFVGDTTTIIDGNSIFLTYTGINYNISVTQMEEVSPGDYTGVTNSFIVDYLSAGTIDFTGRTIWNDVSGITRTQRLIITNNPIIGYVLTCSDIEGVGEWLPYSGGTGSTSVWTAGTGSASAVLSNTINIASGNYSVAEGTNTTASGYASHAEGQYTLASGIAAHAEGSGCTASGDYSHAQGYNTTASGGYGAHAEGYQSVASNYSAHAEGDRTLASGDRSHAEGIFTVASNNFSHAEGSFTIASAQSAHAEGQSSQANGEASHAEGLNTRANGYSSHAEGLNSTSLGDYSHAQGYNTRAIGENSHTEGWFSYAGSFASHAEGENTQAVGRASHSQGYGTVANGVASHAEGAQTYALGDGSHAEGHFTSASGEASHAQGSGTTANGNFSHAGGSNTIANGAASFVHGTGSTANGIGTIVLGNNITGNNSNTTYVEDLIIDGLTSTDPIATNANGMIVAGTSDFRLKQNISELTNSLSIINSLRGVSFEYTPESEMGPGTRYGFIAQEVQEFVPDIVRLRSKGDGMLSLNYNEIVPILVEAVKELSSGVTTSNNTHLETQTILAEDNNIDLNYSGTQQTSIGGGITVLHAMGQDLGAQIITDTDGNWVTNNDFKSKSLTIPQYTPTSSNDINGSEGNITSDDNYLYMKTANGWKRSNLESF